MTMAKILIGGAGLAALAGAAAPAAAQYYPYGNAYGYRMSSQAAVDRCAAAVNNRLAYNRNAYRGYGRVVSVAQIVPRRNSVRVTGYASSGRMAYNNYGGINLFGLLGSNYRGADLSFGCTVNYRGQVTDIDLRRR